MDGSLRVNPGESVVLKDDSVVFAMCAQQSDLDAFALNGSALVAEWLPQFSANRNAGFSKRKDDALKLDQVRDEMKAENNSHPMKLLSQTNVA